MTKSEQGLIFILVLAGFLGFSYFNGLVIENRVLAQQAKEEQATESAYADSFGKMDLLAKRAVVYDPIGDKSLFSFHQDTPSPMASIVKVMTAIVALENMPAGTIVNIPAEALASDGDTGLLLNEKWSLKDLVPFMLNVSSNDAATAIALSQGDASSFIEAMNKKAADLGLSRTKFSDETGLDLTATEAGAYSSALDIAKMVSYAYLNHKDAFASATKSLTSFTSLDGIRHDAQNTDILLDSMKNILVSKTGYTTLAGGNLAVVFRTPSGRLLSAVALGSTIEGRFSDMKQLVEAADRYDDDIIRYNDGKNSL